MRINKERVCVCVLIVGQSFQLWSLCQLLFPVGLLSQFSQKHIQKDLSLPAVCSCGPVLLFAGRMFEEMGNVFQMARAARGLVQPRCENHPTYMRSDTCQKTRLSMCTTYLYCSPCTVGLHRLTAWLYIVDMDKRLAQLSYFPVHFKPNQIVSWVSCTSTPYSLSKQINHFIIGQCTNFPCPACYCNSCWPPPPPPKL